MFKMPWQECIRGIGRSGPRKGGGSSERHGAPPRPVVAQPIVWMKRPATSARVATKRAP